MSREVLLELGFEGAQAVHLAPKSPDLECTVQINSLEQEGSGHGTHRVLQPGNITSRERNKLCMVAGKLGPKYKILK